MDEVEALVIGAGPAGLMAAEQLAAEEVGVLVAEAKPSPARKFLMAGKSGLNLTKDEDPRSFARRTAPWMEGILAEFGPVEVMGWAEDLGISLFTGSSGRVFPEGMKASPLLRAWLARLDAGGVRMARRWRWTGWRDGAAVFDTPGGERLVRAGVTVLALGGASWPRLGSDGSWAPVLEAAGVELAPFRPANMGFEVPWSEHMAPLFGQPVKGVALRVGDRVETGEFVISARGVEGGGIYAISAALRDGAAATIDLAPGLDERALVQRLNARRGDSLPNRLRKASLDPVKIALLQEWGRPLPAEAREIAALIKALPLRHAGPRPLAEAISSAGGIAVGALTGNLELAALPGVYAAGEMLDWEAPTGGYLLTGCLATGRRAGIAAAARARRARR
ncbi:NAD(P)/FAD-dependent oxidoreductase [Frigidibacter sp. MR17.24]|uniref:NAD(P)/FAD-dependent oxidoreductase n=1 Tax=Frigidibacter sp. MR17.24 TaxID=3127345 RepID=UPI0030130CBE